MFFIYGVVTIAESVFFVMLLFKAYQTSRNSSHTPILTALLKQGTLYYFVVLAILTLTMFAPFSNGLYWPIANAFPIVPIVSIACNRLILSLRGMVFAHSVVRGSAFGMSGSNSNPHSHERAASSSGSGNHPNNGSGSGSGGGHSYLPNIHNKGHSRRVSSPPRQVPRMQIQRSSTIVTFSDDWREGRNHHPLDNAISLDTIPANTRYSHHDQRAAQRPWSEADKPISLHPMAPIRR
ncbi:hypothetical protein M408DRAFT_163556 [Serendipita vermifera MAFF 305830]|uniref:Uncharacterized protein n=1 Tax=Serendipita vermifera MAFF 305830 TaxID=933852 RepID=A0A0C2WN92_SERVB|nr:hypothetical protein M408DRAFT_163556 [Serendipita vermifera MAFF 305830]